MNKKFANYFLYMLIFIFLSMSILSGAEVINNYDLTLPERIYVDSYLAQEIDDYIGMALDYAIYYKNDEYVNDINNINQYEIDSYKQKIEEKIESQYQNIKSIRDLNQSVLKNVLGLINRLKKLQYGFLLIYVMVIKH